MGSRGGDPCLTRVPARALPTRLAMPPPGRARVQMVTHELPDGERAVRLRLAREKARTRGRRATRSEGGVGGRPPREGDEPASPVGARPGEARAKTARQATSGCDGGNRAGGL